MVASATLLYTARANNGWGGGWGEGWGGHSQRPSRDQLGPVFTPGFTSLREEGARQMRQRHAGVWRQGRNSSLENSGAEIRVEQRGGETVIEFARSGEAQGELSFINFICLPLFTSFAECSRCFLLGFVSVRRSFLSRIQSVHLIHFHLLSGLWCFSDCNN